MVASIAQVEAVTCDSAHEAAWLERNLLEHRRPPWNRATGGQEAEGWIRLSVSPRSPGLTVMRQPAPGDFGPYLGGQKVRDAVCGLARGRGRTGLRVRGRLQAELEALDWVTGEQKVTRVQGDADVCGWADGVLVWFEIRGGRDTSRLGGLRPPQCRIGGSAQVVRWQKLNQLPESSRSSASMP